MLPFVYLDKQDLKGLVRLIEMGATLSAQQVPGGREHIIDMEQIREMGDRF